MASASTASLGLAISLTDNEQQVKLDWNAPANSTNTLEYADQIGATEWHTLTNFISGPVNARVTVKDAAGAPLRVYRVRVDAGE